MQEQSNFLLKGKDGFAPRAQLTVTLYSRENSELVPPINSFRHHLNIPTIKPSSP